MYGSAADITIVMVVLHVSWHYLWVSADSEATASSDNSEGEGLKDREREGVKKWACETGLGDCCCSQSSILLFCCFDDYIVSPSGGEAALAFPPLPRLQRLISPCFLALGWILSSLQHPHPTSVLWVHGVTVTGMSSSQAGSLRPLVLSIVPLFVYTSVTLFLIFIELVVMSKCCI